MARQKRRLLYFNDVWVLIYLGLCILILVYIFKGAVVFIKLSLIPSSAHKRTNVHTHTHFLENNGYANSFPILCVKAYYSLFPLCLLPKRTLLLWGDLPRLTFRQSRVKTIWPLWSFATAFTPL